MGLDTIIIKTGEQKLRNRDKISVIIPTYNAERTIRRAINSVWTQNIDCDIEILVCDDCSTDRTTEIAKSMGAKIFKNREHTGGPNAGRNLGIRNASGKYFAFLDQDDEWLPDKLKLQMQKIEEGFDVVSSSKINRSE